MNDKDTSKLFSEANNEQPPASLDATILATAQSKISNQKNALGPFSRRWSVPVSVAAVVIMSVSLVTLIQKKVPDKLASLPESAISRAALNQAPLMKHKTKEIRPLLESMSSIAQSKMRSIASPETVVTSAADSIENKKPLLSPIAVIQEELLVPSEQAAPTEPKANNTQEKVARQLGVSQSQSIARPVAKPKTETTLKSQDEAYQDSQAPVPKALQDPVNTAEQSVIRKSDSSLSAFVTVPRDICATTTLLDCLESMQCVLVKNDNIYSCRKAGNHCEQDFAQNTGTAQQCHSKPGCKFSPGKCFCPPDVVCVCGGGPPKMCVLQ